MQFLIIAAVLLVVAMAAYAAFLWRKVYHQNQRIQQAQAERRAKLADSIDIIAMAMVQGQCNVSEGVLRLKPLAEAADLDFTVYPAMNALHEVVAEMPILEARKQLKRNERMKLDLVRESAEAEHQTQILAEAEILRQAVQAWLPKQA